MNKIKKIRNFMITSLALFFLSRHSYKLVEGYQVANEIYKKHLNSKNHVENIVAHRGFSGLYLENSKESINAALESDCVDMIEIDVRITDNKKIVLHHDAFINYLDVIEKIEKLKIDDDENINYVIKNYPFCNLSELLHEDKLFLYKRFLNKSVDLEDEVLIFLSDIVRNYSFSKPLIIDVKTNFNNISFMEELDRILKSYKDLIYIQSDCFEFIDSMIKIYPDYKYLYIIKSRSNLKNKNDNLYGYTVRLGLFKEMKMEENKMYLVYTINSVSKYLNLLKNKNYNNNIYIITDHPDYICALGDIKKLRK